MADRVYLAVLANLLYESQPPETIQEYQNLVRERTRGMLTFDEGLELRNLSPLTLLSKVLGVRRSLLDDKIHGARWEGRTAFENERAIDSAIGNALSDGTFEAYGVDVNKLYTLVDVVTDITGYDKYGGGYYPFIENDDLRQEFILAISEARINLDLIDPQQRLYDPYAEQEVIQPAYYMFGDTTNSQEQAMARAVKEHDPFGFNALLESYDDDFESGVWGQPYEENQDTSEVWMWFREFYETR